MKMKYILFALFLLPCMLQGQNYIVEITPKAGEFRVLLVEKDQETFPRSVIDYGFVDSIRLKDLAYQQILQKKRTIAALSANSFIQELNENSNIDSVENYVSLNYQAYANQLYSTTFDGLYQYQVVGQAINLEVTLENFEIRNAANNNLLATFSPNANNWITVTIQGTGENIQLFNVGEYLAGRNAANQVVTLTPK